ncbi:TadE/TadG family type IV pilus assembly protein [Aeromonas salmonicida]|uniref:TadE/TadG family type IV pilus assembly protein n=1 Tax=Aeromonas salmonicida TaxID=645 RepID=UPI0035BF1BE7
MRRELGVASIELVIILPLLLALLLLVVDVLRVHLQYSTLEHGLRSVLRELQAESAAGRIPSADGIRLRLQQRGRGELDGVTVSVIPHVSLEAMLGQEEGSPDPASEIRLPADPVLEVTARVRPRLQLIPSWLIDDRELSYQSTLLLLTDRLPAGGAG